MRGTWPGSWRWRCVAKRATLLDSYEPERMPVARTILMGSDRGFYFIGSPNCMLHLLRSAILPRLTKLVAHRSVGERVFQLLSQIWISYRTSPVVAGDRAAKAAQPGDHVPYALFDAGPSAGQSILTLLRGVDHHLLLFPGAGAPAAANRTQVEALLAHYQVDTQIHVIDRAQGALYTAYGVQEPTAFLVRPDGHIAWRGDLAQLDDLAAYMDRFYIRRESALLPRLVAVATYAKEKV
ncbi:MAG: hypothetical protein MI924_23850 [Chloroflexales bacterium]|nr:hypothetical protein [Chloroflexales bacterium]